MGWTAFWAIKKNWSSKSIDSGLLFHGTHVRPNSEKMVQVNPKCAKWSENILKVRKIFQLAVKYINNLQSKALQNLHTQIGIFWFENKKKQSGNPAQFAARPGSGRLARIARAD
jgi:hypothetical protein